MVIKRVAKSIDPGAHRPGATERINEHRTLAFGLLVLELIDVHQDGLPVADHELYRGPIRLGFNLRFL